MVIYPCLTNDIGDKTCMERKKPITMLPAILNGTIRSVSHSNAESESSPRTARREQSFMQPSYNSSMSVSGNSFTLPNINGQPRISTTIIGTVHSISSSRSNTEISLNHDNAVETKLPSIRQSISNGKGDAVKRIKTQNLDIKLPHIVSKNSKSVFSENYAMKKQTSSDHFSKKSDIMKYGAQTTTKSMSAAVNSPVPLLLPLRTKKSKVFRRGRVTIKSKKKTASGWLYTNHCNTGFSWCCKSVSLNVNTTEYATTYISWCHICFSA